MPSTWHGGCSSCRARRPSHPARLRATGRGTEGPANRCCDALASGRKPPCPHPPRPDPPTRGLASGRGGRGARPRRRGGAGASAQAQGPALIETLVRGFALTLAFISRDLSVMRRRRARIIVLHRARIVANAPTATRFAAPKADSTRTRLAAIPLPDPDQPRGGCTLRRAGPMPKPGRTRAGRTLRRKPPFFRATLWRPARRRCKHPPQCGAPPAPPRHPRGAG